jgi:hypothetical protein
MRREREASRLKEEATGVDDSPSSSEDDGLVTQTEDADDMFSWENEECVSALSNCQALVNKSYWTKDELEKRSKIAPEFRAFCNAKCRRKVKLEFLQEYRSQEVIVDINRAVPDGECCNGWGCTPWILHGIVTTVPPVVRDVGAKPSKNTMAWFALQHLKKWCSEAAGNLEDYRDMWAQPAGSLVLRPQQQRLIAQQFSKVKEKDDWKLKTVSALRKLISPEHWTHSGQLEAQLVQMLDDSVEEIISAYQNREKSKARRRDSNSSESGQGADDSTSFLAGSQLFAKDNAVARMTLRNEVEERRARERVRAVRISMTEVIPITNDVPDEGSCLEGGLTTPTTRTPIPNQLIVKRRRRQFGLSRPVTPIYYKNGGKRPTRVQEPRRNGEGHKDNRGDMQSSESDIEPPESPETPVLRSTASSSQCGG